MLNRSTGYKLQPEPMMTHVTDGNASIDLNELKSNNSGVATRVLQGN